jgi:hypothetical protein
MITAMLVFFVVLQFIVIGFLIFALQFFRERAEWLEAELLAEPALGDEDIPAFLKHQAD